MTVESLGTGIPTAHFDYSKHGTIIEKEILAERIARYEVFAPLIAQKARPGQFVILRLTKEGERVPLTIVDRDAQRGTITLIVQVVGKSTELLDSMPIGEQILDVLGPLGNPSEIRNFGRVVVIGGGVGTAVAYPVAKALKDAGNHVTAVVGARTKDLIILRKELENVADELYITTDDGSFGFHGFVTDQLKQLLEQGNIYHYALAVGPLPMMRAITEVTRPYGIPTTVSLNPIMVDGTGMCGGCRVTVGGKVRFTCVEGPEFDGHLVDFDTLNKRNRAYNHLESCRLDEHIAVLDIAEEKIESAPRARQAMPELPVTIRVRNFDEVALGFTDELALKEAARCLQCKNPKCVAGCPVSVQIPQFIKLILSGKPAEAALLIKQDNSLPGVCGRVCPQTEQCEGACILGKKGEPVAIGALERYVTDYLDAHPLQKEPLEVKPSGHKVALVGSGPACLSCAGDLIKAGHEVTIFEAFHDFGGVLRYGIPEFRLPKVIVSKEVQQLSDLGVKFVPDVLIGATKTIRELMDIDGYEAVFIGTGAGLPNFLSIPGENLVGIYSANEFLTRVNLMKAYLFPKVDTPILNVQGKRVAVIGGGNTALDSARVALRLGAAEVSIVYRRSEAEMPGRFEEIQHAKAEGVRFEFLRNPLEFLGNQDGWLVGMRLIKMELGEPDSSGRRRPCPIPGSDYETPVDVAVVAIGNGSNPIIQRTTPDLEFNRWGNIVVDPETMATSIPGVYAGGDIVTGGATVILAMGAGRKAAAAINRYLTEKKHQKGG
ncbi:MAG: NADPH-dependent glutamate synthase [Chloroflexi bacterium]|jgi:glutamate synthase (NADPH/NADH) small chain|nr:NADPH-dependent glutamate synthase [Anaerolineaceae bacterium]NLI44155.1 NADPH-dependent glutamate synthase [Chloroflexota bacterium]HOE34604.1 NADPH-dependent glutamate synthase [Anaerolineaceae bacterium]HOT24872.1 NADPH-dependent glutamate synthase [Anaerolineaceae bacterium]HQH57641.1 NADPH-dependent glutamate synthase [Anaerolineaceae bacterium]